MALQLSTAAGAVFWAYISPQNNTGQVVTDWSVTISQGPWSGSITSADPQQQLQTPGLSGIFQVVVTGAGPSMPPQQLSPQSGSKADLGCNNNCAAMVGIVANSQGDSASYWTVWDAFCN